MLLRKLGLYIGLVIFIILSACSSTSNEVKIYDFLEEAVQLEAGFEEQQDKIIELEKKEQEIFNQISDLESNDIDEITKHSKEAIESIKERKEAVDLEKESIANSRETFEKVNPLIEKIEKSEVKEKAEEMYEVMINRYDAYDQLHKAYLSSLEEETKLYTILQNEDLTQEELTKQITVINEVYEQVIQGNDKMNEATNAYNTLKKDFYNVAELNVSSEKD